MLMLVESNLEGKISRRKFLKDIASIGTAVIWNTLSHNDADACTGDNAANAFYERIVKPLLSNPELLEENPKAKGYLRMDDGKDRLLKVLNDPARYRGQVVDPKPAGNPQKEPLYVILITTPACHQSLLPPISGLRMLA